MSYKLPKLNVVGSIPIARSSGSVIRRTVPASECHLVEAV